MASAHDRAVLQAIFNPTTPFGDIPGLNQEEELIDDGEHELLTGVSQHIMSQYIEFIWTHSISGLRKTWHCNPNWFPSDISLFSFPRYLSIEFESFFNLFISSCQTVALTESCWSKWKSWRCGVSQQQRLGIYKLHFSCSARQSRFFLSEPLPITTGHRPCDWRGTQQVCATNSIITLSRDAMVCQLIRLPSLRPAWIPELCLADALCQQRWCSEIVWCLVAFTCCLT